MVMASGAKQATQPRVDRLRSSQGRLLGRQPLYLRQPIAEARFPLLRPDRDSISVDEFWFDAEEVEHWFQIGLHMLEGVVGLIKAATRYCDDHPFIAGEPFGSGLGIAERLPRDRDSVDPGLKLRRNAEIIHWRPYDDRVGRQELVEHRAVGEGGERQMAERLIDQVALDHSGAGSGCG